MDKCLDCGCDNGQHTDCCGIPPKTLRDAIRQCEYCLKPVRMGGMTCDSELCLKALEACTVNSLYTRRGSETPRAQEAARTMLSAVEAAVAQRCINQ